MIGVDLCNEVCGLWGIMFWFSWVVVVERCGNWLFNFNFDWLIVVEGILFVNDLLGVCFCFVKLSKMNKFVYLVYVYVWFGWGFWVGCFK